MVVTIKELENCTVEYYKDEDCWLTPTKAVNKISVCEPIKDIESVEHLCSSYKFHVMSIVFELFSLSIAFKSQNTMTFWIKKLNDIRRMHIICDYVCNTCYLVCLYFCYCYLALLLCTVSNCQSLIFTYINNYNLDVLRLCSLYWSLIFCAHISDFLNT